MAQKDLGGLKISLTADATQLKSTFETAVKGLRGQKIPVVISATRDPTIESTLDYIRGQKVAVSLTIAARRDSIRQLRMDIQQGINQQGGVKVPVTIKPPTKREAGIIRDSIASAIGIIEVPWTWGKGPGGPPGYDGPPFFFPPPGGGGGASAAGPFRAGGGGSDENVIRVLRQILGVQTATHKATQDETAQAAQAAPRAAAARPVFTGREPRKRRSYKQQEGESDEEWLARTLERRAELIERMSSPSAEVRRKTQQRIEKIDKLLGPSRVPGAIPLGPEYPERIDPVTGEVYRGSKGKLASEARPGPGSVSRERADVQRRLGINLKGEIPILGEYLKGYSAEEQNILLDRVNRFLAEGPREQQVGFKGQRTTRSFFEPGPGPRGEREPSERAAIVEAGDFVDAFIAEVEAGERDDFRQDAKAMEAFKRRYGIGRTPGGRKRKRKGGEFGPDFERLNALLEDEGEITYTGKKRIRRHAEYPQGRIAEALFGTGERDAQGNLVQPGAVQLRARLLTSAASGQLPGVGRAAVRLAVAPNRGDVKAGRLTPEGLEFLSQYDALTAVISEARNRTRNALKDAQRKDAGETGRDTAAIHGQYPGAAIEGRRGTRRGRDFDRPPTVEEQNRSAAMAAAYATGQEARLKEAERLRGKYAARAEAATPGEPEIGGVSPEQMQAVRDFLYGGPGGGGPPGGAPGGFGGGGFYQGGVVPVRVENWPSGFEEGAMAAGPVRGNDDFFRGIQDAVTAGVGPSLQEFLAKSGTAAPGARKAKTAEEKKAEEDLRHARATTAAGALAAAQVRGLAPEPEELENIERLARADVQRKLDRRTEEDEKLGRRGQLERTRAAQVRAQQSVELSPARAVATAAGQIFANLPFIGGRSALLERKRVADDAEAKEKSTYKTLLDQQRAYRILENQIKRATPDSKAHKDLTGQLRAQEEQLGRTETAWRRDAAAAEEAANKVAGATDIIRSFGAGVVGTIAGQILFQGVLGAAQAGVQLISESLVPYMERMGDYKAATVEITRSISDQARAQGGQVDLAVAQRAAQANLNASQFATIKATLEERGAIETSNKAWEEQLRLLAAGRNVRNQQLQGVDRGLFQPTGGMVIPGLNLETVIGAVPSTQELVSRQLETARMAGAPGAAPIEAIGTALFNPPEHLRYTPIIERVQALMYDALEHQTDTVSGTLDDLNQRFAGTGIEFVEKGSELAAGTQEAAQMLRDAGFGGVADELSNFQSVLALSADSIGMSSQQIVDAFTLAATRGQKPSPAVLAETMMPQMKAVQFGIQQNLKNQLETFIPAQRGLRFLAQPLAPFGQTFQPLTPNVAGPAGLEASAARFLGGYSPGTQVSGIGTEPGAMEVPPEVIATFNQYEAEATAAIDAINAKAREGEQVLRESLGVPESTISELRGLGARIADLTQQQNAIRLDLQYSQYNRQLFLARRTLGDLAGLTGRSGATQIGLLERELLMLGRKSTQLQLQGQLLGLHTGELQQQSSEIGLQSQLLQLELSQRQINFQRAVAGFVAPGLTPEERAARVEEAKIEADYAQKQLDFQKQQAAIAGEQLAINREQIELQRQGYELAVAQFEAQVALQDAQNQRAYEDQLAIIQEIQKAFSAQAQIQALEEMKQLLTIQRDLLLEEIQAQVGAMEELAKAQAQFSQEILSQTGDFVEEVVTDVTRVFNGIAAAFRNSELGRLLGMGGAGNGTYPNGDPIEPHWERAAGFSGRVSGATHMIVGEAGPEEVAILKNPRNMMLPGSDGGSTIQIVVTGNNVYDEASEARLAARIASEVEQVIGRKASQSGFRFASR